ncbi:MAG: AIR synthase-related protein, partial [Rikenellaceae bacterium]
TGFGLLGHSLKMAEGSGCTIEIDSQAVPLFDEVEELLSDGCIPGAAFRNLEFVSSKLRVEDSVSMERKMALADAQTSGGLLMAVDADRVDDLLADLHSHTPHTRAAVVGEVCPKMEYCVRLY